MPISQYLQMVTKLIDLPAGRRAAYVDDLVLAMADAGAPMATAEVVRDLGVSVKAAEAVRHVARHAPHLTALVRSGDMTLLDAIIAASATDKIMSVDLVVQTLSDIADGSDTGEPEVSVNEYAAAHALAL